MAGIVIKAEFEPDDDEERVMGPLGVVEALMPLGLYDIDVEVN